MSTYSEVQQRINNDYLNRNNFSAETKRAILGAIRFYERKRWDFNTTSTALTTSAGQSYVSIPSNFLVLDDLRITINGEDLKLDQNDAQALRDMNTATTNGQPTDFAIYQRRFELFPTPDSAWSMPVYYIKSLTTLSADSDTNAWIQGGMEDVIVYHATKLMWANVIRNDAEATKFAALERNALMEMTSYNEQFFSHKLKATKF